MCTKHIMYLISLESQYQSCTKLLNHTKHRSLAAGRLWFEVKALAKKTSLIKNICYDYLSKLHEISAIIF